MSQSGRESEAGASQGGPPPGWPTATPPDQPAANALGPSAFGPGMTLHGEPFAPAFPSPEPINPFGSTNASEVPPFVPGAPLPAPENHPVGRTMTEPDVPAPATVRGPVVLGPDVPHIGVTAQTAPLANMAKPVPARKSKAPVLVGVLAISVAVMGAIGFVVYRQRAAADAEPEASVDVPKKKKKTPAASATAETPPPPPAPTPAPTEEPEAEPSAEPSAEPQPTASPSNTAPKPAPTPTQTAPKPAPTPTQTAPKPAPTPTQTTPKPAPTPTTTGPSLKRPIVIPGLKPKPKQPTIKLPPRKPVQ